VGEVSSLFLRIFSASRVGLDGSQSSDIDRRLLIPLLLTSVTIQAVTAIVRITTTYRAIELHLPVVWVGVISAVFAILPIFLAVRVGRFMDRGNDAQAAWIGSGLLVTACAGFWLFANSLTALLLLTALFGIAQLFLMASQQCCASAVPGPAAGIRCLATILSPARSGRASAHTSLPGREARQWCRRPGHCSALRLRSRRSRC
jgi:hypothetical protein